MPGCAGTGGCLLQFVDLGWAVEGAGGEQELHLEWRESGGPPVAAPSRHGLGIKLIERGLRADLGRVAVSFAEEGVVCVIRAPLGEGPQLVA